MRRPGTDETNVQMSDVLCDFCHRQWSEDIPMIEGHQGSCICGKCLTVAYTDIVLNGNDTRPEEFTCPMCLESDADRAALERAEAPGWQSPMTGATICRRCVKQAAGALHKSKDFQWTKPSGDE